MQLDLRMVGEMNHGASASILCPNSNWSALAGQSRELAPATLLFAQGSPSLDVFYVERGLVKLIYQSEDGRETIVGLRSKGSFIGAASAIVHEPHLITAITVTNCLLTRIPADAFLHLAKTDEKFCWYLHQTHSREVYQQIGQQIALRCLSARERFEKIIQQFFSLARQSEKPSSFKPGLPLKLWEIAQLVGVTPEHLSRVMKQIKQEGTIHREGEEER